MQPTAAVTEAPETTAPGGLTPGGARRLAELEETIREARSVGALYHPTNPFDAWFWELPRVRPGRRVVLVLRRRHRRAPVGAPLRRRRRDRDLGDRSRVVGQSPAGWSSARPFPVWASRHSTDRFASSPRSMAARCAPFRA